jgi:hypothetical protein
MTEGSDKYYSVRSTSTRVSKLRRNIKTNDQNLREKVKQFKGNQSLEGEVSY